MNAPKRVYLIERPLTAIEADGFRAVLHEKDAKVYLAYADEGLEQAGALRWAGLTAEQQKTAQTGLLECLDSLGHLAIGKKTISSLLYFQGFPTWYYHRFRINVSLQQLVQRVAAYQLLAAGNSQLVVYTHKMPDQALSQLAKGVIFVPATTKPNPADTTQKQGPVIKKQLGRMFRRFIQSARKSIARKVVYPEHLMVLNHDHLRHILDPEHLPHLYKDNVFAGYFLRQWADQFLIIDKQLIDKGPVKAVKIMDADGPYYKRNLLFNEWVEALALLNPAILWKCWRYHRFLGKSYRKIYNALKKKDPLQLAVFRAFTSLHNSSLYFFFIYQAYRQFFNAHNFRSVTLLDEYSPNFRAIVDAARQEGVRTQAIQHGSLATINPGYRYTSQDKAFNPWPDRTLVWGQYWKDFLIEKAAYPPESIFVTGQIRTDIIPALKNTPLEVGAILGKQTANKFLILLATQPQPNEEFRQRAALDTFTVAREMPNAWVVLKPHPRETDLSYYTRLAEQTGCTNYSIHYDTDLFLLLRLCHVLVHCYSTVGVEAVNFGLPAIILDYLNQDLLYFAREGVALQALHREDLQLHLAAIAQGKHPLDENKRQAYIQKYACAIDGRVGERTAQALLADGDVTSRSSL